MNNVILARNIDKEIENIRKDGPEKLHILTDFDQILTQVFVDGKYVPSLISILRDENYLTPDYPAKAKALYAKYHPIEIDPVISLEARKKAMEEWWTSHFQLLIKSGLNKKDIQDIIYSNRLKLRLGIKDFFELCSKKGIPVIILSSCGLGSESIRSFLNKEGISYENIHIISNEFEWDKDGNFINFKKPIIHSANKDEILIKEFPVFNLIKNRKNVLLIGNGLDDVDMVVGFEYDNLIKIGFLNERIQENLDKFRAIYDIIILNDGSAEYIYSLLKQLFKQ